MLFVKKEWSAKKYLLFFLFIAAFLVMFKFERNIPEKVHMAQYGLFGVLVYNALRADLDAFDARLYTYGSVICFAAGAFDEVVQFFLPNRYFTWHDFFINGASGIMVLLAIRFLILKRDETLEGASGQSVGI
jgi:VanZ family protein